MSQTVAFTIPAGHTGFVSTANASFGEGTAGNYITAILSLRDESGIRRAIAGTTGANNFGDLLETYPIPIPEKNDVEMYCFSSAGAGTVTAGTSLILIKND